MKKITPILVILFCLVSCQQPNRVDITPHRINPYADVYYQQALALNADHYRESALKALYFLDLALSIDSLNPHYYGLKARIFIELGLLDTALMIQSRADELGAINGEYLFQLGLLQAARDMEEEARRSFWRSNEFLTEVVRQHPDSLGAFVMQRAAYALYVGNDSLFMPDQRYVFDRFPDRAWDLEMTRRLRPSGLITQIKDIEMEFAIEDFQDAMSRLFEDMETR